MPKYLAAAVSEGNTPSDVSTRFARGLAIISAFPALTAASAFSRHAGSAHSAFFRSLLRALWSGFAAA
jgi:hypothetical protein